jgi:hypothetical protein
MIQKYKIKERYMRDSQHFTLYCKGKPEDIGRFKARVAALGVDSGMDGEDDTSIHFTREGRPDMYVYADFLPLMAEFTEKTGAPLSFFFADEHVERVIMVLGGMPEYLKTPDFCLTAVKQNGFVLKYVPEELRTPEMCLAAVQERSYALEYVPEHLKTAELCLAAVKGYDDDTLEYVPEELKTAELYLAAVQKSGFALEYVPEELKTPEL